MGLVEESGLGLSISVSTGKNNDSLTRNYQVREEMDRNVWKSQLSQEITYCVRLKRATVFRLLNIPSQNHSIDWIPNLV